MVRLNIRFNRAGRVQSGASNYQLPTKALAIN
uniref:Uncharacterized protein n=1 Tax=Anguilla anguilla TaxID=7936 RepID=A0A0E9Q8Z2_ANGAN